MCIYNIYSFNLKFKLLFLICKSLWIKASAKWLKSKWAILINVFKPLFLIEKPVCFTRTTLTWGTVLLKEHVMHIINDHRPPDLTVDVQIAGFTGQNPILRLIINISLLFYNIAILLLHIHPIRFSIICVVWCIRFTQNFHLNVNKS